MEIKIMLAAAIFFGGWLWSYLFVRQLMFNFRVAYPLIRSMNALREDLIAVGAKRYTGISVAICLVFAALVLFVVIRFCPVYLWVSFLVGAVSALAFLPQEQLLKNMTVNLQDESDRKKSSLVPQCKDSDSQPGQKNNNYIAQRLKNKASL